MNGQTLLSELEDTKQTELDRLGSDKGLLAATNADLEPETVLSVVAATAGGLQETFTDWAAASDGAAADAFEWAADTTGETHDHLVADLDTEPGDPPPAVTVLVTFDDERERLGGGLVGHGLVFDRLLLQGISFFVNEADEAHADQFRDLRTATNDRIERGASVLEAYAETDADWDRAAGAAHQVIETAYEAYVGTLDELGIDPKPVC